MVYKWTKSAQRLLQPPLCLLCDAPGARNLDLCDGCHTDLPWNSRACRLCALPLPAGDASLCAACMRQPPPYDRAFAPLRYAPPVDFLLAGFKFRARLDTGRLLGNLFARALAQADLPAPDLLLPVPLHRWRLLGRGFNQAAELARPAARQLKLDMSLNAARRVRRTRQQSLLGARQRHANLRGAFRITGDVRGLDVAIVDDVITTGDTAAELARSLKRAGATRVQTWALARAARPSG